MPIARIRTLDPEAISFLAARLAASGFQLQFSAPNDTDLDDADLEIIVTRMDSSTALQQARIQAEEMGVDVTVMSGALDLASPVLAASPSEELVQETASIESLERETYPGPIRSHSDVTHQSPVRWTTPYHADVPESPSEFRNSGVSQPDETQSLEPSHSRTGEAIVSGLKHSAEVLGSFTQSSVERFSEWKRHSAEVRAQRRAERDRLRREAEQRRLLELSETASAPASPVSVAADPIAQNKLRLVSPPKSSRRFSRRDQNYRRAAVVAAMLLLAIMLGWSVMGMRTPANPIGKSNLTNVQQQTPFGAASVSAPVQTPAPNIRPAANPRPSSVRATRNKPTPTRHARTSNLRHRTTRSSSSNDDEVVVRHFGSKSVAQQAKAKTRDGVKVITEE